MDRITRTDLDRAFQHYRDTAARAGLITPGMELKLDIGNKTYGVAYRLYEAWPMEEWGQMDAGGMAKTSGHYRPMVGDDYLGMTAREAYDRLHDRARVLGDALHALEKSGRLARETDQPADDETRGEA